MSTAPDETRAWSPLKWTGVVVVIFGVQVGLMFWLSPRRSAPVPAVKPTLEVRVSGNQLAGISAADSPTLLVAPNPDGFSSVWLRPSPVTNQPAEWNGQPDGTLQQPVNPPGGEIAVLVNEGLAKPASVLDRPRPEPEMVGVPPDAVSESTLRIEGGLARRALLVVPKLVSPVGDAALSNTIVEIDVNADGVVVDSPVIPPGGSSGLAETDAYARNADAYARIVAKSLQFKPLPRSGTPAGGRLAERTWGRVVFQWRTLPPPVTNALPAP